MNKFSSRLKELRIEQNLTQEKLAEDISYKKYSISDWEKGRAEPDFDTLIKIAKYFKVTTDYLLGLED